MKFKLSSGKQTRRKAVLKTTIMELLYTLSDLTKDDGVVVSALVSIFDASNVRLAHGSVPVRLVRGNAPLNAKSSKARRTV